MVYIHTREYLKKNFNVYFFLRERQREREREREREGEMQSDGYS